MLPQLASGETSLDVVSICALLNDSNALNAHANSRVLHWSIARSSLSAVASLKPYLEKLIQHEELSAIDTEDAWVKIMEGVPPEQAAALLCLMRAKGETATEIAGCVRGMKSVAVPVHVNGPLLDIVGTGGDGAHTINISTASVILAAAAGAKVCKFGNRSVSSMCGSADVLEALGISVDLTPDQVAKCCDESNIAFMFAPNHYPAMKNIAPVRKALGIRTVFNILGPMTNPAGAQHAVIGVFDETLMPLMAGALKEVCVACADCCRNIAAPSMYLTSLKRQIYTLLDLFCGSMYLTSLKRQIHTPLDLFCGAHCKM